MKTIDSSHRKPNKKHSAELPSPLETLLSGKAGPLPLDNSRPGQDAKPEPTAATTPLSAPAGSSGNFSVDPIVAAAMKNNPGLTAETMERYLAES